MNVKFYRLCCTVLRPLVNILFPTKVEGLENIPAEGGFIICCNHMSMIDPVYIVVRVRNRHIRFMAKKEIFETKLLGPICRAVGAFPVDRGHNDLNAVRTSLQILKEGHPLGIFPQGTRSKNNERTPMLGGVSLIAMRAGVPVIPAYIDGPYRLFRRTLLKFGSPIDPSVFGRKFDGETMANVTNAIENGIWSMRPAEKQK